MRIGTKLSLLLSFLFCQAIAFASPTATPDPVPAPSAPSKTLGTLIVYPIFDIRQGTATEIRIVNYSSSDVRFHYNYVCPGIPHVNQFCAKLDRTIVLTPHESRAIDVASQNLPCNQGFILGYPVNNYNQPISYNFLGGSYKITNGRRLDQDNAVSIRSVREKNEVLGGEDGFNFTGGPDQDFAPIAPLLLSDFKATEENEEGTVGSKLVLLDLGTALGMQNPTSSVFVDFWSSDETPFSSALEFICWTELKLENIDNNFKAENLGTIYGSLQAKSVLSCPVAGACPPFEPRAPLLLGVLHEYGPSSSAIRGLQYVPCKNGSFDPSIGCVTPTPTPTPTNTPTNTPTPTPSNTPTNTPTATPSDTPTNTPTATPSDTPTNTPTSTPLACNPADNAGSDSPNGCPCIGTFDCCGICSATNICTGANRPPNGPDPGAAASCFDGA